MSAPRPLAASVKPEAQTPVAGNPVKNRKRPKRVPIAESRNVLTLKGAPEGYVYRWVQDYDDRLLRFYAAGYTHVHDTGGTLTIGDRNVEPDRQLGSVVSKVVGTNAKTGALRTDYLLAISQEWYDEDQKAKQLAIDESVKALDEKARKAGLDGAGTQLNYV